MRIAKERLERFLTQQFATEGDTIEGARVAVQQALDDVKESMRLESEEPEEMRDFYAGAALCGLLMGGWASSEAWRPAVSRAWDYAEGMMAERKRRKGARDAVNSTTPERV